MGRRSCHTRWTDGGDSLLDVVQQWLWRMSPVPQFVLLLAITLFLAFALRALLLRGRAFTPTSATVLGICFGLVVLPVLLAAWSAGLIAPSRGPIEFDQRDWAARPWVRYRMADDLVEGNRLDGLTRTQVITALGEGDGSTAGDDAWMLYRPRDAFVPMPPELVVNYDQSGRVNELHVDPGLLDTL